VRTETFNWNTIRVALLLLFPLILLSVPECLYAQPWSGILDRTRAIDWSRAGIPGGIPSGSWTQSGSTIVASQAPCSNGAGDCTATIQTALNACAANYFVLLGAGKFRLVGSLTVPSNCVLRGSGPDQTQLSLQGTSRNYGILIGTDMGVGGGTVTLGHTAITSGATAGSTSIVVSSASGITLNGLLIITQNDTSYMSETGYNAGGTTGPCNWCNQGIAGMGDSGQTVRVTSISGTTIGITPPLYMDYSANSPRAFPMNLGATNAGIENLKVSANNIGVGENIDIGAATYSWVKNVESDFADGDHLEIGFSVGNMIVDSFFHDGFVHQGGGYDDAVRMINKASGTVIQNNILWRMHTSIIEEWGASGNVVAYNNNDSAYHNNGVNYTAWQIEDSVHGHGAHPMMNLFEGNISGHTEQDTLWGTSSHATYFRNWHKGSRQAVPVFDSRGALQPGSAAYEEQNASAFVVGNINFYTNQVGDVTGSDHLVAVSGAINSLISPAAVGKGVSCYRVGYTEDETPNPGGNPNGNLAITSLFQHGINNCVTGAITWSGSITHTLPPSFYLSSKPAWWGSGAWPAIGPDVIGGNISDSVANGHVNTIPALNCFNTVTSNGKSNSGTFNADTCYGGGGSLVPPSNLQAVPH
jgi:hypothetical protein